MTKLFEIPMKLTANISIMLSVALSFAAAVAWTAARDAISIVAPIMAYSLATLAILTAIVAAITFCAWRFKWLDIKLAELNRDKTLANNEARQANIASDRAAMHLMAEGRLMAATVRQVENGLIHPAALGEGKFRSFPAQVINQIERSAVPLLESTPPLPASVDLLSLMTEPPTLDNLILGVGKNGVIRDSLKNLTHLAVAGSTRWGKSIFTQQLLYQIALSADDTTLHLADLGGTTFVDFGLPYASTLADVETMVIDVMSEAERRKDLYEATGRGIKNLAMYNQITGQNLPWVILAIDECLYLMEKSKTIKENLEVCVSWAAKYGISCLIVSQDFKATIIATSTRNNFGSRFQFCAEDQTQASVLIRGSNAHEIVTKGRCFARLPGGNGITEIQTPFVSEAQIMAIAPHIKGKAGGIGAAANNGPVTPPLSFVVAPDTEPADSDRPTDDEMAAIEAFVSLRDSDQFSWNKVTAAAFGDGRTGKNYKAKLTRILDKFGVDYSEYESDRSKWVGR